MKKGPGAFSLTFNPLTGAISRAVWPTTFSRGFGRNVGSATQSNNNVIFGVFIRVAAVCSGFASDLLFPCRIALFSTSNC
jgi:hypothetical protein